MQQIKTISIIMISLFLSACTSAKLAVVNIPVKFSDTDITRDVSYGDAPWQKLDIYRPKDAAQNTPVIIFFYGGRWTFGQKEQYAFAADRLMRRGYIVVVPDYAKYPAVKFPTFVMDGARAVAWVHDNITAYGGDANNIFVSGHSSGAHIGALVAADPSYLAAHDKPRAVIAAFAGLAGPYDFEPEEPDLKDMFAPPSNYPNMQVTTFIDGKQPPMFLLHGGADKTVYRRNVDLLRAKINQKGGIVKVKIYDDVDHTRMVSALSWVYNKNYNIDADMDQFFKQYIR